MKAKTSMLSELKKTDVASDEIVAYGEEEAGDRSQTLQNLWVDLRRYWGYCCV